MQTTVIPELQTEGGLRTRRTVVWSRKDSTQTSQCGLNKCEAQWWDEVAFITFLTYDSLTTATGSYSNITRAWCAVPDFQMFLVYMLQYSCVPVPQYRHILMNIANSLLIFLILTELQQLLILTLFSPTVRISTIFKRICSKECDISAFLIFLRLSAMSQEQNRTFYSYLLIKI